MLELGLEFENENDHLMLIRCVDAVGSLQISLDTKTFCLGSFTAEARVIGKSRIRFRYSTSQDLG